MSSVELACIVISRLGGEGKRTFLPMTERERGGEEGVEEGGEQHTNDMYVCVLQEESQQTFPS